MNKTVREIFIGMLLGDGHIRRSGASKAYISFEQSSKKTEYLNYVRESLAKEGVVLTDNLSYTRTDLRHGSENKSIRFSTRASEDLKPLADMFLDEEGKKIIPSNIGEELTAKSLAHLHFFFYFAMVTWFLEYFLPVDNFMITNLALTPLVIYTNADTLKEVAVKENNGKCGVYR